MTGWLIVNEFLRSEKFDECKQRFIEEAKKCKIRFVCMTNTSLLSVLTNEEKIANKKYALREWPDFVLFWDKDIELANYLENKHIHCFNSAHAIECCDNKVKTHFALQRKKLPMPKTVIAPMTYTGIGYRNLDFLEEVEKELSYPLIIKESYGSFGQQVYFIENRIKCEAKTKELEGKSFLYQQYIKSSHGKDIRLQVVGDKVIAGMIRFSQTDFRANITNGGTMKSYVPTKEQCDLAVKACKAVEANFAGVDLLFGKGDEMLVCEVNSNAHFINIEQCTKVNVAGAILKYIEGIYR